MIYKKWWKYLVLRGANIPARLDGMWYEIDDPIPSLYIEREFEVIFVPTNQWEQREDGEVAVVYRPKY